MSPLPPVIQLSPWSTHSIISPLPPVSPVPSLSPLPQMSPVHVSLASIAFHIYPLYFFSPASQDHPVYLPMQGRHGIDRKYGRQGRYGRHKRQRRYGQCGRHGKWDTEDMWEAGETRRQGEPITYCRSYNSMESFFSTDFYSFTREPSFDSIKRIYKSE